MCFLPHISEVTFLCFVFFSLLLFFVPCRAVNRVQSTDCHRSSLVLDLTPVHCYFTGHFIQDQDGDPTAAPVSSASSRPVSVRCPVMFADWNLRTDLKNVYEMMIERTCKAFSL